MNIEEKFARGYESHTYQRIDTDYKINIFLGYNDNGQMSMVITELGKETLVKSSKLIDVSLKRREDQKIALTFDLLDSSYKSMFLLFCKDIILFCEKAGSQIAIAKALTRWKYWKEMFGKKKNNILEKMEIKGLLGELIELRDYFMKEYGEARAIQGWMGPLLGHKDFEIGDTWYEIKTVSENAVQVNISSIEQLESDVDGHLMLVRLEDTSSVSNLSINLNKVVISIIDIIEDTENMDLFQTRLDNVGFEVNQEYENYNFIFKGMQSYSVTKMFPRIQRKDIHQSIGNVKYTIMLDGISEFKEE